mgnify:CR=1 FL=1
MLEALQQYFTQSFSGTGTYLIIYGVLFLVVILLLPRGVVPSLVVLTRRRQARAGVGAGDQREPAPRGDMAGVTQ